jgi:hypothetical protein
MGEVVKLPKAEIRDDDSGMADFMNEDMWRVGLLRRLEGYSVMLWRDSPGFWRWEVSRYTESDALAHSARSFPSRHEALADAWRGWKRFLAEAAKGSSR